MPAMGRTLLRRTVIFAAAAALLIALVPLSQPLRHAAAWRVAPESQKFVDLAVVRGAPGFGMRAEEYRRITRPRIVRRGALTCVTLATHRTDGGGSYTGCFEIKTGSIVTERFSGISFGRERLWDRLGHLVW